MPVIPDKRGNAGSCINPPDDPRQIPRACLICPATSQEGGSHAPPRSFELRNKILSMLSHDIRTPLTVITANAEMLAEFDACTKEERFAAVERIKAAAHNTSVLLDDFLTILRLESGDIDLKPGPTPLPSVVALTVGSLEHLVASSSATIHTAVPEDLPHVMVDTDRFPRVITNIVTNALKHCHEGVNVRITARIDEASKGNVLLEVADDGPGISGEDLKHIFDWDSTRKIKNRANGHGLGLMVVKTITELHGGTVDIDSREGSGTTVRLTLPTGPSTP